MKQNAAINVVETNMTGQKSFSIKSSAKAFKILSSGIYQNKIKAVIRELSSNAYDAHVAAGNSEQPFDVHMPTVFEPHFAVRDYGIGMDDAKIKKLYTTYFDSTKDQSNDFIGALGIGSKSPFSYTDNYTVTSWSGTEKRIYSCYVGEDGTPAIVQMGKEPSTEARGIEVRLAVAPEDNRKFEKEAESVYYWFDVTPNGLPTAKNYKSAKEIYPGTYSYEGNATYSGTEDLGLRMGQVYYPIKLSNDILNTAYQIVHRGYSVSNTLLNLKAKNIMPGKHLMFKVNIGDVDMTASREDLEYTVATNATITKLIGDHVSKTIKLMIDAVLDAAAYDDANLLYQGFSILHDTTPEFKWNDLGFKSANSGFGVFLNSKYVTVYDMTKSRSAKPVKPSLIEVGKGKVFVILKDKPTSNIWERFFKYREDNKASLFSHTLHTQYGSFLDAYYGVGDNSYKFYFVSISSKKVYNFAVKALDKANIKYILSSQLPALVGVAKGPTDKWELDYYPTNDKYSNGITRSRGIIDPNAGGWYVINSEFEHKIITEELSLFAGLCEKVGYITNADRLYSVPKRLFGVIGSSPGWQDFGLKIDTFKVKFIKDCETIWKKELDIVVTRDKLQSIIGSTSVREILKALSSQIAYYFGFYGAVAEADKNNLAYEKLNMYAKLKNLDYNKVFGDDKFIKRVEKYIAQNPILELLKGSYISVKEAHKIVKPYLKGVL